MPAGGLSTSALVSHGFFDEYIQTGRISVPGFEGAQNVGSRK